MTGLDTEVVVIGGGPVGLATALELDLQGVATHVLEAEPPGGAVRAKAGSVSFRSVEYCRRWGLQEEVYHCGFPEDYPLDAVLCVDLGRAELGRHVAPSMATVVLPDHSPVRRQRCPQMWFDPILSRAVGRAKLAELSVGWSVDDVEDRGDHVLVSATSPTGQRRTVTGRYAAVCEGAAGTLRERLGITQTGNRVINYSMSIVFRCPTLRAVVAHGDAARYILMGEGGTWGNVTVIDGTEFWRLTVMLGTDKVDLDTFDAAGWVVRAFGGTAPPFEVVSALPWRRSAMVADTYRAGNAFLVGDSAHTMSNTGGFGMNTGLSDAVNLGWKVAATLRGWGGPALLDSYDAERRPVALRNIRFSNEILDGWMVDATFPGITGHGAEADRLRARIGATFVERTHDEWATLGASLGYRYHPSPVCVTDGEPPPPDTVDTYEPSTVAGCRAPHAWLPDGTSTIDHFVDAFTVVASASATTTADPAGLAHATRRAGTPVRELRLEGDAAGRYAAPLVLVRPDGHVAWRGDEPGADAAARIVRTATGHP